MSHSNQPGLLKSVFASLQNSTRNLFDAFLTIFGPNKDDYPSVGVQPFEGDPPEKK